MIIFCRILSFVREAESKITLDDVIKEHKPPSTHGSSLKNVIQSITLGKVEGSIEVCYCNMYTSLCCSLSVISIVLSLTNEISTGTSCCFTEVGRRRQS